jgi:hypothetical protein
MLISESDDGRATAWIRQNAGKVLNAVKNSGEARRTIIGGTNLPESTSCAEMTLVFSSRRLRRAGQDCARDVSGARQQSASAHPKRQIRIDALKSDPLRLHPSPICKDNRGFDLPCGDRPVFPKQSVLLCC